MVTAGRRVAGDGADHVAPLALAGAGPLSGGADRVAATPTPPYTERARWDSYPHRAQPDQICRDRISSPADRRQISPPTKTAPYGWIDGHLRRICNRGCRW